MQQEQIDKLVSAIAESNHDNFQSMIEQQEDLNELFVDGLSLLGMAICAGDTKAVGLLLEAGASPQMECHLINDFPAEGCNDKIKLGNLLAHAMETGSASTREQEKETQIVELISPLSIAMNAKNQDAALLLVEAGACNKLSQDQLTSMFHCAARHNLDKVLSAMIEMGFEPNCMGKNSKSPLMEAACSGSIDCVMLLLKAGANIHQRCSEGMSAADYAESSNCSETLKAIENFSCGS